MTRTGAFSGSASVSASCSDPVAFSLAYHEPFAWDALLDFLEPRAIPGVESVDRASHAGGVYLRTFRAKSQGASQAGVVYGWLSVRRDPEAEMLRIAFETAGESESVSASLLAERVGEVFDLAADGAEIDRVVSGVSMLADHVARVPGVRVPGAFDRFETAVRAILGQQISVKGATTLAGRIASRWGDALPEGFGPADSPDADRRIGQVFPSASALVDARLEEVGLTRARANTIRGLAQAVLESADLLRPPAGLEATIERWQALAGIGPWTAHYVAMRVLRESDALPVGDLGLRKAITKKALKPRPAQDVEKELEGCRPYRAYAAMRLWALLGEV